MEKSYDRIYVINLDRAPHRWEHMEQQLGSAGVEYIRFPAIDGLKIDVTNVNNQETVSGQYLKDHKIKVGYSRCLINCEPEKDNPLTFYLKNNNNGWVPGEMALWCSNVKIWQEALANNYHNILVFEDDIRVKRPNSFKKELDEFLAELPDTYDVAFFSIQKTVGSTQKIPDKKCINSFSKNFEAHGTYTMIFSTKGMEKLLGENEYDYNIDFYYIWHNTGRREMSNGEFLEVYSSCYGNELMIGGLASEMGRF